MWLIFILACLAVALLALCVIWVGSKVIRSMNKNESHRGKERKEYAGCNIRRGGQGTDAKDYWKIIFTQ